MNDIATLKSQVADAIDTKTPLHIVAGQSKAFYGRITDANPLDMSAYRGIVSYEPTELVITAKAGTTLAEIEKALDEKGQMLAFEPPRVNQSSTLGGSIACGLSGPRRPFAGSARDFVLGIRCLNGLGQEMSFGGQVMKNVAGYDLSRLLTGSMGTLAIILEVSLKVLPKPKCEMTVSETMDLKEAYDVTEQTAGLSVSAAAYDGERLSLRFSGSESGVAAAISAVNMPVDEDGDVWWRQLRDYHLPIFAQDKPLWRFSLPCHHRPDFNNDQVLMDWAGAQYWWRSERPENEVFALAASFGGHATSFNNQYQTDDVFQPLSSSMLDIHNRIKQAFDPNRILNPGKMYSSV